MDMTGNRRAATMVDRIVNSVESAMLTEAQLHALDSLCADVTELLAHGREDDARRTMRVAMSLLAGGPPVEA